LSRKPTLIEIELRDGETVVKVSLADRMQGLTQQGGKLWLTNQRLVFKEIVLLNPDEYSFPLDTITWVGKARHATIPVMSVAFSDGRNEKFRVWGQRKWIAAIETATGGNASSSTVAQAAHAARKDPQAWILLAVVLGMICLGGVCFAVFFLLAIL
jgi:hypothetical protein